MVKHLTVIPEDNLIMVDGRALYFEFASPTSLHAMQWHNGAGHLEYTDGRPNFVLSEADYDTRVVPYIALWEQEKARLEAKEAAAEAERLAEYNKPENARARKYAEINEGCQAALAALTATYPDRELLTFERQEREARALLAGDSAADVTHITAIAQGRGIPVEELAQKIIAKADAFALASGALIGQRQWYEDALESLGPDATTAQIEDITVSYSAAAVATQEATDGDSSALPGADGSAS